jgi:hypothetical protein
LPRSDHGGPDRLDPLDGQAAQDGGGDEVAGLAAAERRGQPLLEALDGGGERARVALRRLRLRAELAGLLAGGGEALPGLGGRRPHPLKGLVA